MKKNIFLVNVLEKLQGRIEYFISSINAYNEHEERMVNEIYEDNYYGTIQKQLKRTEAYYDKLDESYKRTCQVIENGEEIVRTIDEMINPVIKEWYERKEDVGNMMNELLDMMKRKEKRMREMDEIYEEENYNKYYIETKTKRKPIEEAERNRRYPIVKEYLTIKEMKLIEKEIKRDINKKIFDSTQQKWNIKDLEFSKLLLNQSHIIIVIETRENQ